MSTSSERRLLDVDIEQHFEFNHIHFNRIHFETPKLSVYFGIIVSIILFCNIFALCWCFKKKIKTPSLSKLGVSSYSYITAPKASNSNDNERKHRLPILIMLICGSCTDYLGKLIYQILPQTDYIRNMDYIVAWLLTAGSFFICSFALISIRKSFRLLTFKLFFKICVPSLLNVFVVGGRYLSIIFLPAAIISLFKNGLELVFLAIISRFFGKKRDLNKLQWIGFIMIVIGLVIASLEDIIKNVVNHDVTRCEEAIFGIILLIGVGFFGAVRNMMEEVLLINHSMLNSEFLVGMESIISFMILLLFAIIYLYSDLFAVYQYGQHSYISSITNYFVSCTAFIILFILFIIAIYGKDTMKMKVTELTSSLTRKLFQQLYPIAVWTLSLLTFYLYSKKYGEAYDKFAFLRIISFIVIIFGTFLYVKPSKNNTPETPRNDEEIPIIN